jgi:thiol peroxidase
VTASTPSIPAEKIIMSRHDLVTRHGAVTFLGNPLTLVGAEVAVGSPAPDFDIVAFENGGMNHIRKADLLGKPAFISVVPSLDTPVCQVQTKTFNQKLAALGDKITALTVSLDLPFAMSRFCGAEAITSMRSGSDYMDRSFGEHWGVLIDELKILARAVFVLDAQGVVRYAQVVTEVASEPDYDAALAALEKLV